MLFVSTFVNYEENPLKCYIGTYTSAFQKPISGTLGYLKHTYLLVLKLITVKQHFVEAYPSTVFIFRLHEDWSNTATEIT
jgi:hypothetical protein